MQQKTSTEIRDLKLLVDTTYWNDARYFIIPASRTGTNFVAMPMSNLRRASGILHNARGSFSAVAQIMADESQCAIMDRMALQPNLANRVVIPLWIPFALGQFWTPAEVSTVDWSGWLMHDSRTPKAGATHSRDDLLYEKKP